jgi:uncharacterized membrane protein
MTHADVTISDGGPVVAIFDSHDAAERAVQEMQRSDFDLKKLSVVGKGSHVTEDLIGFSNVEGRMAYWGLSGAFLGGMGGALFGSALFLIPGVGPLLVAGPVIAWMAATIEGAVAVGGLGVIGAALYSHGISKDSSRAYEAAMKAGKFLLIVHGTPDEVFRAERLLGEL